MIQKRRANDMKHNREFEIAWQGLKPGLHTFQYDLNDKFIEEKGGTEREFKDLDAQITLRFDKKTNFFLYRALRQVWRRIQTEALG